MEVEGSSQTKEQNPIFLILLHFVFVLCLPYSDIFWIIAEEFQKSYNDLYQDIITVLLKEVKNKAQDI